MKRILLFIFLVSNIHMLAQNPDPYEYMQDSYRYGIIVHGDIEAGSGPIDNSFLHAYYLGKHIDNSMKDRVRDRLSSSNRIGGDAEGSLYFFQGADSSFSNGKLDIFVGLKNRAHMDGLFSEDLFNVYFYGNKSFENKTIETGKSNFSFYEYQELQAGIRKKIRKPDHQWAFTLGLSAISGQDYYGLVNKGSELYTAPDGEYLYVKTNAELSRSSTKNSSFGAGNGVGSSLLLKMEYVKGNHNFSFMVSDLGFINWNSRSTVLTTDTAFRYTGVYLKNIFDTLQINFSDTGFVNGMYNKSEKKSFLTVLPAWYQLAWQGKYLENRLLLGVTGKYRMLSNYVPQMKIEAGWKFAPLLTASVHVQYGGYADLGIGFHIHSALGKNFVLTLGSNYVDGLLLPSYRSGQQLNFSLLYLIK